MVNPYAVGERAVLQKSKVKLFDLVCKNATEEQWAEWLRVPLEHAAAGGDVALVNDLLAAGANGEAGWKGCHNRTLLCAAAQGGKLEVVRALIKAGARPDVNEPGGKQLRSPLHYAALNGCEGIAEELLLSGANPNDKDSEGIAPIYTAAELGYEGITSLLLKARVEVDVRGFDDTTALHWAAMSGHFSVVMGLLIAGASVSLRSKKGRSALDFAVMGGHLDVIRLLGQRGEHVSCAESKDTVLHLAATHNQAGAVDVLVDVGCDVRARGRHGATPLHFAACKGNCGALSALLRHHANVDAKAAKGRTPLMWAISCLHQEAADLLLRWGADENSADDEGRSAKQFIGISLQKAEREGRRRDVDNIHKLLANAPADRAWRRRGLLLLCRAF
ncbi:unnamed protein product, partial [Sphacelaria rigidula]